MTVLYWITGRADFGLDRSLGSVLIGLCIAIAPVLPATASRAADHSARKTATELLQQDWLFQAEDKPTLERIAEEIRWARELAARLKKNPRTPDLKDDLAELEKQEKQLDRLKGDRPDAAAPQLYFAVRRVKRRIMFKNPVVDFSKVLFIDNPYPRMRGRAQGGVSLHENSHRNGNDATPGGRLLVLDGLHPSGKVRKLAPEEPGSFWQPDLSFDAQKVLFCFKPHDEKAYHLYEINIDGTGLRQLTFGNYDDLDPIHLPDGHIMFTTTRCHSYVRCMPGSNAHVLARCDSDGKNIYIISMNNECDWLPALLNDRRVIYSRWEYTDKALWRIQSLWTTNPDGTNTAAFWGNQSVWPDHLAEPRPIPGSRRVMFTGLRHHNWFAGSIGIIDPDKGLNFPDGLTKITADVRWPEVGNGPVDPVEKADYHTSGRFTAYKSPYPLSEQDFLVSARTGSEREFGDAEKFKLYLMDIRGNRELIYEGLYNIWHAIPVRARKRPDIQPDRVAWPGTGKDRKVPESGMLYSDNVYEGVPDLPEGKVRYLRVFQQDHTTYSAGKQVFRFSGPGISLVQEDGVKRILGTVPVQPDGSVSFKVPPGKALHFQLLDEHYRALQTMRSFTGVMPGERRGCVGCHELHSVAPPNQRGQRRLALRREPAELTPPPWGLESIGYERFVQPVLDRFCGECHQGNGEARKKLDLTLRPGYLFFKEPYVTLVGQAAWQVSTRPPPIPRNPNAPGAGIAGCFSVEEAFRNRRDPKSVATIRPMTTLSYKSKLIDIAMSGKHNDVSVDPVSLRRLIAWVDAMCPYRGEPEVRAIDDPNFPGIEDRSIRPRIKTAPIIQRP